MGRGQVDGHGHSGKCIEKEHQFSHFLGISEIYFSTYINKDDISCAVQKLNFVVIQN